jgi:hypothetical protein
MLVGNEENLTLLCDDIFLLAGSDPLTLNLIQLAKLSEQ